MRLPGMSAARAPSTALLSFLRPFSSTAAVAAPPRENHPPARQPMASSTSRLGAINKDRISMGGANARSPGTSSMQNIGQAYKDRAAASLRQKQEAIDYLKSRKLSNDYLRQMPRRWTPGDVYSPHDLSPREMDKWRRRNQREVDVVDALGLRPLDMYKVGCRPQRKVSRNIVVANSKCRTFPLFKSSRAAPARSSTPKRLACALSTSARLPR